MSDIWNVYKKLMYCVIKWKSIFGVMRPESKLIRFYFDAKFFQTRKQFSDPLIVQILT